jgi:hypothetical protein
MNNDELKELAAVLNGIAEGKKWEWLHEARGEWLGPASDITWILQNGRKIRLKQWHLPDPPEGYEWHRTDWTEKMLPEEWRPQYVGESGVEYEASSDGINWNTYREGISTRMPTPKCFNTFFRTKAPLPPPKPKLREVPLGPRDVPLGSILRALSWALHEWRSIDHVYSNGALLGNCPCTQEWVELMQKYEINRSIPLTGKWDAAAWEKCSKMEEVPA